MASATRAAPVGFGDHPGVRVLSGVGQLLGWATLVVAALVGGRATVGAVVGDPAHPVTVLGVAGGGLGAVAMVLAMYADGDGTTPPADQAWAMVAEQTGASIGGWGGLVAHLAYGAAAGGLYPRVYHVLAFPGDIYAALPWSVLVGVEYGLLLAAVGAGYRALGLFDAPLAGDRLGGYLPTHVLYGATLGAVVGLWLSAVA